MLFNSLTYAIFLPCIFLLYWIIPGKYRWVLLFLASYFFYMSWNVKYVVLIATTTLMSYLCAIAIEKTDKVASKRIAMVTALVISLGILYVFKYFNFSVDLLTRFIPLDIKRLNFLLPVGISFYIFQTLSYVIDVYKGEVKAEKNLGIYATFVAFFPQLVAGPIERTSNLMPQIKGERWFDYETATYGIRLILWGLYKKMVIADNLAIWVDQVYGDVRGYKGLSLVIASFFFSLQIYCDFSGYSDIARGSAKLLNIELMENFKSPYYSSSIREFWSRWHISLSTWFKDYVYIPLGGNRVSKCRNIFNNMITFLVSGLWHGANMTFVLWGGLHGAGQACENMTGIRKKEKRDFIWVIRVLLVFVFVTFAWIFFRASSISDAIYVIGNLFSGVTDIKDYLITGAHALGIGKAAALKTVVLYMIPLMVYDYISLSCDICEWIGKRNIVLRYVYVCLLAIAVLTFGYVGQSTFVYFQF